MCISVAIWNRLFVKTAIIHHDAIIKCPDLKGSGRKRKENKKRRWIVTKREEKICQGYYGSGSKREPYIKAADSHLLERNNSCDTCQPLWPGETIKQVWSCLRAMTLCCWIRPKKKKEMEGGETITIYIKSDPVLYCSLGAEEIAVWSSLKASFPADSKHGSFNVRLVPQPQSHLLLKLGLE